MKKIKLCLIAFFAIVFASMSCAFVATSVKHAEAATENDVKVLKSGVFAMDDSGLTLRTNDKVGIRFKVKMSRNLGVNIQSIKDVSLKFLIAPRVVVDSVNGNYSQLVTAAENATEGKVPARIFEANKDIMYEKDGYYWASLVITNTKNTNIEKTNIELDMNVVAYITYTDEKNAAQTRYATTNVEKVRGNLYNVVNSCAVINGYAKEIIGNENFDWWYGSEKYPIKIATTKQAEALKDSGVSLSGKTVLSSVDFAGTEATVKTVTEKFVDENNRQEIVLGKDSYAVNMGISDGNVVKATIGGVVVNYDNGNVTLSSEFKNRLAKHGEQTLTVTVEKDGNYTEYKKKLLVVTKEISSFKELKDALASDSNNVKYGYYRLTQNVGLSESWINVENKGDWKNADGSVGFRGTLDGNGFAVDGQFATHGLFGIIGNGAVVKNITFNVYDYQNGRQALARSITGAAIECVTINIKSIYGTLDATAEGGVITGLMSHTTHYKDVTINAEGKDLDTLFGKSYGNYKAEKANTFENCVVNAKSLAGLVHSNEIISAAGIYGLTIMLTPDTITAEEKLEIGTEYIMSIATVAEITNVMLGDNEFTAYSFADGTFTINADAFGVTEAGVKTFEITGKNADGYTVKQTVTVTAEFKAEEVALGGEREIVLSNGTEFDLDLGEYSSATVLSATLCGENATYSNGKLTVTDGFKADVKKHGMQTLKVTVQKDGKYYNVIANILVVTQDITTFDELKSALKFDKNNVKFGYYRLATDLSGYDWYQSGNGVGAGIWKNPNGELGFRGTFDGNGFSIRQTLNTTGLFGYVGKGAVIKNLTINLNQYIYSSGTPIMVFGYSMVGATVDNVKVNVTKQQNDGITEIPGGISGLLTAIFSYGNTFNKLVVDAQKTDIDTLFGSCAYYSYPAGYEENKFTACIVKANSLIGLACTNNADKTVTSYDKVSGLTVTLGA